MKKTDVNFLAPPHNNNNCSLTLDDFKVKRETLPYKKVLVEAILASEEAGNNSNAPEVKPSQSHIPGYRRR